MIQFYATLQVLGAHTMNYLERQGQTLTRAREDRGSVTIEQVLWAVAVIGIATAVIIAITRYVEGKTNEIN